MIDINQSKIKRIIIHKVHSKTDTELAKVETENSLLKLGVAEKEKLILRLKESFESNRAFQLEIEDVSEESFFSYTSKMKKANDLEFINLSKRIANLLSNSHKRKSIPSGMLLVLDGTIKSKYFLMVIKAELQDAFQFNSSKHEVNLVENLFLSPANDFYKIGVIIEDSNSQSLGVNKIFSCFMYDNQYTNSKNDLTAYFYSDFLGFTTSQNDELKSKSFVHSMTDWIDNNITDSTDNLSMHRTLKSYIRDDSRKIIDAKSFKKIYIEENFPDLIDKYDTEILKEFPTTFTKNTKGLDRKFSRETIYLDNGVNISGPEESMKSLEIYDKNNPPNYNTLALEVDNGGSKIIKIKTVTLT